MAEGLDTLNKLPHKHIELYLRFTFPVLLVDSAVRPEKIAELQRLVIRTEIPEYLEERAFEELFNLSDQGINPHDLVRECLDSFGRLSFEDREVKEKYQFSVVRDMISIALADNYMSSDERALIEEVAGAFYGINKQKVIEDAKKAIESDKLFIEGKIDISEYEKRMKDVVSGLGAVGVPVTAIYFAGSVTGLSAAGITSGLAALGLGGILGLSSMVTGIGVAVLMGVTTYKAMRWILGSKERELKRKREELIQQVIRAHNKAINKLSNRYQELSQKLSKLLKSHEASKKEIELLKEKVNAYKEAFEYLSYEKQQIEQLAG